MIGQGDNGWIKLSRRIVNHWLWDDAERLKWWLDLLMMAAWEERQVMHDSHLITLRRGQMIASVGFLRDRWKRSHQTILRFLNLIEKENMIKRSMMYRQTSIITICNYESYQVSSDSGVDTIKETIKDTQVETIVYINKEDKEYNIYNNNSSSFHSDESEVRELHADPADSDEKKIPAASCATRIFTSWLFFYSPNFCYYDFYGYSFISIIFCLFPSTSLNSFLQKQVVFLA